MPESLSDKDRRIDRRTRDMAQEAKLDSDLGSMVPPRWRGSTVIVVLLTVMTLVVMLASIFF
ncbi:MAG: hypothetical protein K0M49_02960 [Arenimonas sp.]|nr:hypothetical protein [Rhizobium sp.]MBW8444568.1 hypothetical protein [Arenimonas sp.]